MPESNEPNSEVHKSEGERSAAAVDASQKIISALIEAVQKGEIQGGRVEGQIIKYEKKEFLILKGHPSSADTAP